jgi:hypothetical protein
MGKMTDTRLRVDYAKAFRLANPGATVPQVTFNGSWAYVDGAPHRRATLQEMTYRLRAHAALASPTPEPQP